MRNVQRRKIIAVATLCLTLAGACGLSGQSAGQEKPAKPALKGLDPVLLTEGKEEKGKAEISLTREGFRYEFVDAANKTKFEKDPQRFEIQLQGKCAMMTTTPADPDIFTVYKGKIYAFGSEGCRTSFRASPEEYLRPQTKAPRRSVVILVFEKMELLDFTGPAEVFASAGLKVSTVAATKDPVLCMNLITVTPSYTLEDCPRADIVVVPGGNISALAKDKRVI